MRLRKFVLDRLNVFRISEARRKQLSHWVLNAFIVIGFCSAVAYALAYPILKLESWYHTHDVARMPYLTELFRESFEHGFWFPRWVPELMGGYGYPTFSFYQTGFFFLSLPFTYFIPNILLAMKMELLFILTLGGVGAYLLAREWMTSRVMALLCSAFFMVTPYISTNLNPRGAYAELLAQLLIPLCLWFMLRLHAACLHSNRSIIYWALALSAGAAAVVYSHPFTSMIFLPTLGIMGFGLYLHSPRKFSFLLQLALCMALALVLSMPFWVTVMTLSDEVTIENSRWFYGPAADWKSFERDYFNPGLWHMTAVLIALGAGGWRKPFILSAALCYAVFLYLMTGYSQGVWDQQAALRIMQFPWRINSVASSVQYVIIIYGVGSLIHSQWSSSRSATVFYGMAGLLAVAATSTMFVPGRILDGSWEKARRYRYIIWGGINYTEMIQEFRVNQFAHLSVGSGDFTPRRAGTDGLFNRHRFNLPVAEVLPGRAGRISFPEDANDYRLRFTFRFATNGPINQRLEVPHAPPQIVRTPAGPQTRSSVFINQFYLPGWKVLVDGKEVPFTGNISEKENQLVWGAGKNGRIRVNFAQPGVYDVQAWYDGPPGWALRNITMLFLTGMILFAMRRTSRPSCDEWLMSLLRKRKKT